MHLEWPALWLKKNVDFRMTIEVNFLFCRLLSSDGALTPLFHIRGRSYSPRFWCYL